MSPFFFSRSVPSKLFRKFISLFWHIPVAADVRFRAAHSLVHLVLKDLMYRFSETLCHDPGICVATSRIHDCHILSNA